MEGIADIENRGRSDRPVSDYLTALRALDNAGIEWCAIGGYHELPARVSTDLDIVVSPADFARAKAVIRAITTLRIVQEKRYAPHGRAITFGNREATNISDYAVLDILGEDIYADLGADIFSPQDVLSCRHLAQSDIWVTAPDIEFVIYLAKRIAKSMALVSEEALGPAQTDVLTSLFREAPYACRERLTELFPEPHVELISHAAERGDWSEVTQQIGDVRRMMKRRIGLRGPFNIFMRKIQNMLRLIGRVHRPNGLMIAILGPDGAGKTLLQRNLLVRIGPLFDLHFFHHLRPNFVRYDDTLPKVTVTDPHGRPVRGTVLSLAQLAYWVLIYTFGYWFRLYPMLVRQSLLVFDRYHIDLVCDPKRYRYGGPGWVARLVIAILPGPDIYLVLDAPVEILQARKAEVPLKESDEQRRRYRQLVATRKNCLLIDASRPADDVADLATEGVLNFMANRCRATGA